LWVVGCEL